MNSALGQDRRSSRNSSVGSAVPRRPVGKRQQPEVSDSDSDEDDNDDLKMTDVSKRKRSSTGDEHQPVRSEAASVKALLDELQAESEDEHRTGKHRNVSSYT